MPNPLAARLLIRDSSHQTLIASTSIDLME
jgi:hypothetical protein